MQSTAEHVCQNLCQNSKHQSQAATKPIHDQLSSLLSATSSHLLQRLRSIRADSRTSSQGRFLSHDSDITPLTSSPLQDTQNELFWCDNVLTWTRGCKLVRSFTFDRPILQAFWTWLEVQSPDPVETPPRKPESTDSAPRPNLFKPAAVLAERGPFSALQRTSTTASDAKLASHFHHNRENNTAKYERALCIFFQQAIVIQFPHMGEQFDVDLPFRFARAFPLPIGLMIQRQTELEDERIADSICNSNRFSIHISNDTTHEQDPKTPIMNQAQFVEEDAPLNLLPMLFYLRHPFDELGPVDRFPQISTLLSLDKSESLVVHGSASSFTSVDEVVVFISTCSNQCPYPLLVTASHRTRSIRIYHFITSPDRPHSTSTLVSSPARRMRTSTMGDSLGLYPLDPANPSAPPTSSDPTLASSSYMAPLSSDPNDPNSSITDPSKWKSSNGRNLGRGLPNTRKNSVLNLERRSSNLNPAAMGRDPSGRSRRLSAIPTGKVDRRLANRTDEVSHQGRDRTIGNASQTADGLRRQSQAYPQESLLDDLGPGNVSVRMAGQPNSSTRLRRASQAARTPYKGHRTASKSAITTRARQSLMMQVPDASIDVDFDRTSMIGPASRIGVFEPEMTEANEPPNADDDTDAIQDLDSFARSFAAVSLLEEIAVGQLYSSQDATEVKVHPATFREDGKPQTFLYISVPCAKQTFCRHIDEHSIPAERGSTRKLSYASCPHPQTAKATIPSPHVVSVSTMDDEPTQVMWLNENQNVSLSLGPLGEASSIVDLGHWSNWKKKTGESPSAKSEHQCEPHSTHKEFTLLGSHKNRIQLGIRGQAQQEELVFDFVSKCQLTRKVINSLSAVLEPGICRNFKAYWIRTRFATDKLVDQGPEALSDHDWRALEFLLCGESQSPLGGQKQAFQDLAFSAAHRQHAGDSLLSGIKGFSSVPRRSTSQDSLAILSTTSTQKNPLLPSPLWKLLGDKDLKRIAAVLHMLAQDARLDTIAVKTDLPKLSSLLLKLSYQTGLLGWFDYWTRLQPTEALSSASVPIDSLDSQASADITFEAPFDVFQLLVSRMDQADHTASPTSLLAGLLPGISLPLTHRNMDQLCIRLSQTLQVYRAFSLQSDAPIQACKVVQKIIQAGLCSKSLERMPLGLALPLFEAIRSCQLNPPKNASPEFYKLIHRKDLALSGISGSIQQSTDLGHQVPSNLFKTLPHELHMDPICAQLFSRDHRLSDAVKMLNTSAINTIYVSESENQSEAAIVEQHNAAVAAVCERTKAIPVGRGMLLLASQLFRSTEKWPIPPLCLTVKVLPRGVSIEPETKADPPTIEWPEFHNGVASILELVVQDRSNLDSKWIFSHLGNEVTAKHAGFLFGLGLINYLPALTPVHVFRYLKTRHSLLTIGFLLGLAAASVGTADPTARHLIGIQLVAFLPAGSAPLNLSTITQTAGLLAMGLVFLGSNHRWTAKRMLVQIGAQEASSLGLQPQHREAYSLAAGLALGLVLLGKGRTDGMKSLPDKRILSQLSELINGPSDAIEHVLGTSAAGRMKVNAELSLTSIPASVALGLIFLRSNREDIAKILPLPRGDHELDYIRPDVLLVRVLARHLILWDEITPSEQWIHGTLPLWIQQIKQRKEPLSQASQLAYINMRAGTCLALGLKYAGSHNAEARACLMEELSQLLKDVKVKPISYSSKILRSAIQTAIDLVVVSLGMVMSGSGDIDILRILRMAHGDVDSSVTYGSHMATHMAIGLLFLGGGRFTLGTSDLAIAVLLIAFFPRFPGSSSDNRAHLQAFRHLWVLAVEPRLLIAKDVDTDEVSFIPLQLDSVETSTSKQQRIFAPSLLPRLETIYKISTDTCRYWPASLEVGTSHEHAKALLYSRILHVQRKTGHLSYAADPHGSRSIFSRSLGSSPLDLAESATALVGPNIIDLKELVDGFSNSGKQKQLVDKICDSLPGLSDTKSADHFKSFLRTMTMECMTLDKEYIIPFYTKLGLIQQELTQKEPFLNQHHLADLQFINWFYRHCYPKLIPNNHDPCASRIPLIQPGLISKLVLTLTNRARDDFYKQPVLSRLTHDFFKRLDGNNPNLVNTVITLNQSNPTGIPNQAVLSKLAFIYNAFGLPKLEVLVELRSLIQRIWQETETTNNTNDNKQLDPVTHRSSLKQGIKVIATMTLQQYSKNNHLTDSMDPMWIDFLLDLD